MSEVRCEPRAVRSPCRLSRTAAGCCLFLLWAGLGQHPSQADEQPSETTLSRLDFRVLDVGGAPLKSFEYRVEFYSAGREQPTVRDGVPHRSKDDVLRIPKPYPTFGRVRIWIKADDVKLGYRRGYAAFSYRIDPEKPAEPATIQLESGIVLTGTVLDATTGKPIAGADVAPLKWGHHFSWADWDESSKTDAKGNFRVATGSAKGIAARHPRYRGAEVEHRIRQETFRLDPLLTVRGRVVDADGKPIAGASIGDSENDSDKEGRFGVQVTRRELAHPQEREVSVYAEGYRYLRVPLAKFSLDRETVVTLEPEQLIGGQVLDADGNPPKDCKIELKCEARYFSSDFRSVPHNDGKWERHIGESDDKFTLRVSVGGAVRFLRQYSLAEVSRGPIITRLAEGRRLIGKLTARVPLSEKNTPVVLLTSKTNEDIWQQGKVQADGSFAFHGLDDGTYVLELRPAISSQQGGGPIGGGVGAFTTFGFNSPNKPWTKEITIRGQELQLDPIDLHKAGLLPGRVRGVAYHPETGKPFANVFAYVCSGENDFNSVGGSYYLLRYMTDAEGRFQIDPCPPGKYVLRLSDRAFGYAAYDPSVWMHVRPEKEIDLRLFAPDAGQLAIDFTVGDGSLSDIYAGAAVDAEVIAKYADPKTGEVPFIKDRSERVRAQLPTMLCQLEPVDSAASHWPIYDERFNFSPANLMKDNPRDIVIPNVSRGRWRLTLIASYDSVFSSSEKLLTREFTYVEDMAPVEIELPPSGLSGTFENPGRSTWGHVTIEAVPQEPGLPTRTCRGQICFRFMGLAAGTYSLRFSGDGCQPKRIDQVIVQTGKVTWLENVVLESARPGKTVKSPAEIDAP